MTLHRATRFMLALALLELPAAAGAQAFALNEIGSCALARGFATTSAPCDDASEHLLESGQDAERPRMVGYGGAAIIALRAPSPRTRRSRVRERTSPRRSFRISSSRIGARARRRTALACMSPTA